MADNPILYWPKKSHNDATYQLARKVISQTAGAMPEVIIGDIDISDIFAKNPGAVIYYPVFIGASGWWGELLGTNATVADKLIISPECQLMVIVEKERSKSKGATYLWATEIYPASGFFKKMNSSIATVSDMLATDAGTILALFSGKNKSQFVDVLESTGNCFLGCVGRY